MLLILSEANDRTTNEVLQWLFRWGVPFVRINTETPVRVQEVSPSSGRVVLQVRGRAIDLSRVERVWFRRGVLRLECLADALAALANQPDAGKLQAFVRDEWKRLCEYIIFCLERKSALGSYSRYNMNKLQVLHVAQECGLDIPQTLISEYGIRLAAMAQAQPLITKPISEAISYRDAQGDYVKLLTTAIDMDDLGADGFPSLVQERLDKWVELRIFFLRGKCYTMAIFSQTEERTAVDFRNYGGRASRMVPFALPEPVQHKLRLLMQRLQLDTGSIDMVLTRDMRYVFLEVNPVGNIEMVSKHCNYAIEHDIAKILSHGLEKSA